MCLFGVLQENRARKEGREIETGGLVSWGGPSAHQLQHGELCGAGSWVRGHMGGTSDLACRFQSIVFLY